MKHLIVTTLLAPLAVFSIVYVGMIVGINGLTYLANYNATDLPSAIGILILIVGWFCAIIGFITSVIYTIWAYVKAAEHGAFD